MNNYKICRKMWLRSSTLLTALVLVPTGAALAGSADDQQAAPSGMDEIVVTANKRGAESIQGIAASVQAIGQEAIGREALSGFDDYARQASNLTALNRGPGQTQIAFRGVVSARVNFGQPQAQSTTGMYVDEIPITDAAYNPELGLVDVNRIEVLRGPQGTLYGSGAMSGAIRIMPNLPNMEKLEGSAGGQLSNTKNGGWNYQINGAINVPLSEKFAVRAMGFKNSHSGFIDNIYAGKKDYNDDDSHGARVMATLQPSEEFSLTGIFIYNKLVAHGRPDELVPGDPEITQIIAAGESPSQFNVTRDLQTVRPVEELFKDDLKIYGFKANYDFGDFNGTLVGSRFDRNFSVRLDDNQRIRKIFGPTNFVTGNPMLSSLPFDSKEKKYTAELRFASNAGSRVKWVVGGYYENYDKLFSILGPTRDLDLFLTGIGQLPAGQTSVSYFQTPVNDVIFAGSDTIAGEQKSVFGEVTLPVPFIGDDRLSLTLGGRYFSYDQTARKISSGFVIGRTPTDATFTIKENGFSPKVALEFKATDDVLLYGSRSEGFRIGGTNERLPDPTTQIGMQCAAELATLGLTGPTDTYESDSLTNYEVGAKTSWMDKKLRINAALFYIDWKDIQTNVFLQCGFNIKANEASQVSKGIELEVSARVSDSLVLDGTASYTNAELARDSQSLAAKKGDRAPYVPEWNVTAGFSYNAPFGGSGSTTELYVNGDVSYLSGAFSEYAVSPSVRRLTLPSTFVGNLAVGIDTGRFNVGVFVKNLWDERVVTSIDIDRNQAATYTRARPRTVGMNASVKW